MFSWILIILAISFIFGVIKVEQIKNTIKKYEPKVREILNIIKTFINQKIAETKQNKKTVNPTIQNNSAKKEIKEENKEETNNQDAI